MNKIIVFILFSLLLTWPLMFHLDQIIIPESFDNLKPYIDTPTILKRVNSTTNDLMEGETSSLFEYTEIGEISKTYLVFGIISSFTFGRSEVFAHNLQFLISMFLTGLFMYFLAKELTKNKYASILAGILYMTSNYLIRCYFLGHPNQWQIQWLPLIFLFAERVINKKETLKSSILLGIALGIQVFSGSYYTVFLTFMLPLFILFRKPKIIIKKWFWKSMFVALIISLIISSPFIFNRLERTKEHTNIRSLEVVRTSKLDILLNIFIPTKTYGLSLIHLILTIIGIVFLTKNKHKLKKYIPYIIFIVVTPLIMIGPISKFAPYYWLYKFWPLFNYLRVSSRIFIFLLISSSILGAYGFKTVSEKTKMSERILFLIVIIILIITYMIPSPFFFS